MPVIKHYDELIERAEKGKKPRVVVPCPESEHLIEGLSMASHLAHPILIGKADKIKSLMDAYKMDAEVIDVSDPNEALYKGLDMVHEGHAHMIMKGNTDTPQFMRTMLDKEHGLRTGKLLSHIACLEVPGYQKLIFISDAGLNIRPTYDEKISIIENLANVLSRLGYEQPKVALMSSLEFPHHDMPDTFEAAAIAKLSERGQMGSVIVDGPLAIDVAMDPEAVAIKKLQGPVMGDADALVMPDVVSGNVLAKALAMFAKAKMGGFVAGAKVPIVLLSRSDTPERKLYSLAFAAAAAGRSAQGNQWCRGECLEARDRESLQPR